MIIFRSLVSYLLTFFIFCAGTRASPGVEVTSPYHGWSEIALKPLMEHLHS